MAFYKFTGSAAEYYSSIGLTAQPGYVYDFGSDTPPVEAIVIDGLNTAPSSRWTPSAGPATDYSLRSRQASDLSGNYASPQGAWSGATTYTKNAVVTYGGSTYRAVVASTNVTPGTDGTKWESWGGGGTGGGLTSVSWDGTGGQPARPVTTAGVPVFWVCPTQPTGAGTVGGGVGAVDGLDIWIRTP